MIDSYCDASYWYGLLKTYDVICVASKLQLKAHPHAVTSCVSCCKPWNRHQMSSTTRRNTAFPPRKVSTQLPDPTLPSGARSCRAQPSASRDRLLLFTIQSWPHQLGTLSSGQKASYDYAGLQDCKVSALFFTTGAPDSTKSLRSESLDQHSEIQSLKLINFLKNGTFFRLPKIIVQLIKHANEVFEACPWWVKSGFSSSEL